MRKTAVIGCIKLAMVSHDAVFGTDLVDTLYKMLRDRDPQVVSNCICALNEILTDEGGAAPAPVRRLMGGGVLVVVGV